MALFVDVCYYPSQMGVETPNEIPLEARGDHREHREAVKPATKDLNFVDRLHGHGLETESFEEAEEARAAVEQMVGYRSELSGRPFGAFFAMFEDVTNARRAGTNRRARERNVRAAIEEAQDRIGGFSPRVLDLHSAILADLQGEEFTPAFEMTNAKIDEMRAAGDLQALWSPDVSWVLKLNRIRMRLEGYLMGARALDKREGHEMELREMTPEELEALRVERQRKLDAAPRTPPSRSNESKPSMDEMERLKEGERATPVWTIKPPYGGYFRRQSFSQWDSARNVWREPSYTYSDVRSVALCENERPRTGRMNVTMTASVPLDTWVSVEMPYTHGFHKAVSGERAIHVKQDQNGDIVMLVQAGKGDHVGQPVELSVVIAPDYTKTYGPHDRPSVPDMPAKWTEETQSFLDGVQKGRTTSLQKSRALSRYARKRIKYSNESKYNAIYDQDPDGYFASIDRHQKADCDVGNTYYAALAATIGLPVRHIVGDYVKGQFGGMSMTSSGTGHGWSEYWDAEKRSWERCDATSAGDPQLDDGDREKSESGGFVPGDYGQGPEVTRPSDEELAALHEKLTQHAHELSYTKEEMYLAKAAGIELKEARDIVREIAEAERTRLPNGELVVDVLARLFGAIVDSRKITRQEYSGPVRKREGGEGIQDIVAHTIGIRAGESDPMSRERPEDEEAIEDIFGGLDLYIIGDKSGSMHGEVEGETLWKAQQRAEYLLFSALHRFERGVKRASLAKPYELSIRSQGISFTGARDEGTDEVILDTDKELSGEFSAVDKVRMWHSLAQVGVGNDDVEALKHVYEQITAEEAVMAKHGGTKERRLRLVIAHSDGGPTDPAGVQFMAGELGKLGAVVVGLGLTETAESVKMIFDTPHSKGELVEHIDQLPAVVAKYVVAEAIRLFPRKAQEGAHQLIARTVEKFRHVN